jgi:hypothetical protein
LVHTIATALRDTARAIANTQISNHDLSPEERLFRQMLKGREELTGTILTNMRAQSMEDPRFETIRNRLYEQNSV